MQTLMYERMEAEKPDETNDQTPMWWIRRLQTCWGVAEGRRPDPTRARACIYRLSESHMWKNTREAQILKADVPHVSLNMETWTRSRQTIRTSITDPGALTAVWSLCHRIHTCIKSHLFLQRFMQYSLIHSSLAEINRKRTVLMLKNPSNMRQTQFQL